MQYLITINQDLIVKWGFKIDLIDAAIIDFLRNFFNSAMTWKKLGEIEKIYENDEFFFLVDYSKLRKEMPLLKISSNDRIGRRLSNLVKEWLLERSSKKQREWTKTYFRLGPKYSELVFSSNPETESAPGAKDGCAPGAKTVTHPAQKTGAYIGINIPNNIPVDTNVSTENTQARDLFGEFWKIYPRKEDRKNSEKKFASLSDKDKTDALAGLRKYASYWNAAGTARQYIPHPSTFINGRRWEDEIPDAVRPRPFEKPVPKNVLVGERDYSAGTENFQPLTH